MKGIYHLLVALACLTIVAAGIILLAARWRWIRRETWATWRENRLWKEADRKDKESAALDREAMQRRAQFAAGAGTLPPPTLPEPEPERFIVYAMADGSMIGDEFSFVTDLEWFDSRDREERLIKRTYALVSEEELVLPDPYPIEDDDDGDDAEQLPQLPEPPAT